MVVFKRSIRLAVVNVRTGFILSVIRKHGAAILQDERRPPSAVNMQFARGQVFAIYI